MSGIIFEILKYPKVWIIILTLPLVTLVLDMAIKTVNYIYVPTPADKIYNNNLYYIEKHKNKLNEKLQIVNEAKSSKSKASINKSIKDNSEYKTKMEVIEKEKSFNRYSLGESDHSPRRQPRQSAIVAVHNKRQIVGNNDVSINSYGPADLTPPTSLRPLNDELIDSIKNTNTATSNNNYI